MHCLSSAVFDLRLDLLSASFRLFVSIVSIVLLTSCTAIYCMVFHVYVLFHLLITLYLIVQSDATVWTNRQIVRT